MAASGSFTIPGRRRRQPPEFISPALNMETCFDNTYFASGPPPQDPAAQIVSVEISNNPPPPNSCSSSND